MGICSCLTAAHCHILSHYTSHQCKTGHDTVIYIDVGKSGGFILGNSI